MCHTPKTPLKYKNLHDFHMEQFDFSKINVKFLRFKEGQDSKWWKYFTELQIGVIATYSLQKKINFYYPRPKI